ncbi:hypothetical protein NDA01_25970 [Trichocoleus desertorum AS-A10]|uniref:hypothetical protein n=1 Tax=Trichocoleus desertorum TaxID=1481672 RepID=UPI00329909A1
MTSRIVLDTDTRAIVDQIQGITKASSPSHAIALIVSRYAKHLLGTWELDPVRYPDPSLNDFALSASTFIEPVTAPAPDNFRFDEPIEL